jgi:hypothetical protein
MGKYEHDPAYDMPLIPALARVTQLARMSLQSTEARFLVTEMTRQMNKVNDQIDAAVELVDTAIEVVKEKKYH